jgi:hypothetical protein
MAPRIAELAFAVGVIMTAACSSAPDERSPNDRLRENDPAPLPSWSPHDAPARPRATCIMQSDVAVTVEERRLTNTLPGRSTPFAQELLEGTGFESFERDLATELCANGVAGASSVDEAKALVTRAGTALWRAAVDRVQRRVDRGTLPAGDDRMLYWARLTMAKTLRRWTPSFALTDARRAELEWELERASRGQYDIDLPAGPNYVRIVLSGFEIGRAHV